MAYAARVARWFVRLATLASVVVLLIVALAWPRSCFYADKWWVRNTNPIPPLKKANLRYTGWDPDRWTYGAAWLSQAGCVMLFHADHMFAPGRLVTRRVTSRSPGPWLPEYDAHMASVPYWALAAAAAVLPAAALLRRVPTGRQIKAARWRVGHLMAATTIAALGLAGYVQLGVGGALIAGEGAAVALVGSLVLIRARRSEPTRTKSAVLGVTLLSTAIGLAWFYVDSYAKFAQAFAL